MASMNIGQVRLGPAQYAVLAVTVLVVLPIVFWTIVGPTIYQRYLEDAIGPRVQRQFAFEVAPVPVGVNESGPDAWLAVSRVTPGSQLERAGVKRGDTGCLGVDTGGMGDIYSALDELKENPEAQVSLSNADQGRQPCRTVTIRR